MDISKLFSSFGGQSKILKIMLAVIGGLVVLLAVFKVGEVVGYRKAHFSYRWGENYHRNFAGPRGGFFDDMRRGFGDKDFINAHGTFGSLMKIDGNILIVKSKDDTEKSVLVSEGTTIRSRRESLKVEDLKADDQLVIIGAPNEQGQIDAKLIRVFR